MVVLQDTEDVADALTSAAPTQQYGPLLLPSPRTFPGQQYCLLFSL
jgi:hypothetical protein